MRAIITAAGRGTRLSPLTLLRPKCMLEIMGVSILENMLQILKRGGIDDIVIVTGYKAECLKPLIKKYGLEEVHYEDYASKNSVASLKLVKDKIIKDNLSSPLRRTRQTSPVRW